MITQEPAMLARLLNFSGVVIGDTRVEGKLGILFAH